MVPEVTPHPEVPFHIDDLNEVFNEKLPEILKDAPYAILAKGYRPYARAGVEKRQAPELVSRIKNDLFRDESIQPEFESMDFSVEFDPIGDEATKYTSIDIHWTNGTRLHFHDTHIGVVRYPLQGEKLIGEVTQVAADEFKELLNGLDLPRALHIEDNPMRKIDDLLAELADTDMVRIERNREVPVNIQTTMDVQFAATYGTQVDCDEKGLVQEVALNLFRYDDIESPFVRTFQNTTVFKIDEHGKGAFYAAYDCPLIAGELFDEYTVVEHRLKTPTIRMVEQLNTALTDLI